jgi:hypothetical protein
VDFFFIAKEIESRVERKSEKSKQARSSIRDFRVYQLIENVMFGPLSMIIEEKFVNYLLF